jgi:hypothetical protein
MMMTGVDRAAAGLIAHPSPAVGQRAACVFAVATSDRALSPACTAARIPSAHNQTLHRRWRTCNPRLQCDSGFSAANAGGVRLL